MIQSYKKPSVCFKIIISHWWGTIFLSRKQTWNKKKKQQQCNRCRTFCEGTHLKAFFIDIVITLYGGKSAMVLNFIHFIVVVLLLFYRHILFKREKKPKKSIFFQLILQIDNRDFGGHKKKNWQIVDLAGSSLKSTHFLFNSSEYAVNLKFQLQILFLYIYTFGYE